MELGTASGRTPSGPPEAVETEAPAAVDVEAPAHAEAPATAHAEAPATAEPAVEGEAETCPNCGAHAVELFCARCGQKRGTLDVPVWRFLEEYLRDVFLLEGRLWKTVRLLLTQPGAVTADYLAGRRARYTPPLRLYIGSSLVFFGLVLLTRSVDSGYYGTSELLHDDLARTMPRALLFSVPLFALGLKLVYLRSARPLVHHVVFTLHLGTTALILFLGVLLLATAYKLVWGTADDAPFNVQWLYVTGPLLFAAYQFVGMHRVYPQGPIRTVVKFWLLTFIVWPMSLAVGAMLPELLARLGVG